MEAVAGFLASGAAKPYLVRLVWDYFFIILPSLVSFGAIIFRAVVGGMCCCTFGIGCRIRALAVCFAAVLLIGLITAVFALLFPYLVGS